MRGLFFYWLTRGQKSRDYAASQMTHPSPENAVIGHAQSLAEVASGHNAKTANDDASVPLQATVDIPVPDLELRSIISSENCTCIVCLHLTRPYIDSEDKLYCPVQGCTRTCFLLWYYQKHVKLHYRRDRGTKSPFFCPVENCHYNSKRFADLERHTTANHCTNPAKFECPELGCKYNGEGNGFTRKDKLAAHKKAMHYGHRAPGQAVRALKPAPAATHAGASGPSSAAAEKV